MIHPVPGRLTTTNSRTLVDTDTATMPESGLADGSMETVSTLQTSTSLGSSTPLGSGNSSRQAAPRQSAPNNAPPRQAVP